jgi:hypothetical protein
MYNGLFSLVQELYARQCGDLNIRSTANNHRMLRAPSGAWAFRLGIKFSLRSPH